METDPDFCLAFVPRGGHKCSLTFIIPVSVISISKGVAIKW